MNFAELKQQIIDTLNKDAKNADDLMGVELLLKCNTNNTTMATAITPFTIQEFGFIKF